MADVNEALLGEWFHSHEESKGDLFTFRPPHYAFPLSRGRRAIRFMRDGIAESQIPGATDKRERSKGTWKHSEKTLQITAQGFEGSYEIKEASPEVLILRRVL